MAEGTCYPIKNASTTGNIYIKISDEEVKKLYELEGDDVSIEGVVYGGHERYPTGVRIQKSYEEVFIDGITIEDVITNIPADDIYPLGTKITISGKLTR